MSCWMNFEHWIVFTVAILWRETINTFFCSFISSSWSTENHPRQIVSRQSCHVYLHLIRSTISSHYTNHWGFYCAQTIFNEFSRQSVSLWRSLFIHKTGIKLTEIRKITKTSSETHKNHKPHKNNLMRF